MAEIERRVEKKKRKRRGESFVGEEKKKKRGKKRDFDGRRFTVRKQPFLPPFYSFLFLVSIYPVSTSVIICPFCYLKLFVLVCGKLLCHLLILLSAQAVVRSTDTSSRYR